MSHKTIYIDVDEEITSIVDRIRKSQTNEVIIVVPKRALLIQSLVNLKLLKKESVRRKKRLMIVTQDRIGKKLIEKAGILVQGKMDDTLADEEVLEERQMPSASQEKREDIMRESENEKMFGSSDYFDEPEVLVQQKEEKKSGNIGSISFEKKDSGEKSSKKRGGQKNTTTLLEKARDPKTVKGNILRMTDIVMSPKPASRKKAKAEMAKGQKKKEVPGQGGYFQFREKERQKNLQAENYFRVPSLSSPSFSRKEDKVLKVTRVKGKSGKYFAIFLIAFFVFGSFAAAYFYLPRATIILHMKTEEKSVSANVEASTNVSEISIEDEKIPAKKNEIDIEKTDQFEASGSGSGSGKASGKIVIYNEFSSDDQPLVATTRFETDDGKIFRITKNIVVPGMAKVSGELKPGAIEVEVMADKAGEEYNIDPTTFKIPGFAGGPKYEKFYAKSDEAMSGGTKGETAIVTSSDVAEAKEKLILQAQQEAVERIKEQLGPGNYFFEDSVKTETADVSSSKSIGAQADMFNYTVKLKFQVLSFKEDDLKELIAEKEKKDSASLVKVEFNKNLNYLLSESSIENGFLKFEIKTDVDVAGGIDIANFKKGVLGKNSEELENLVGSYPTVKNADVNFWPFFANRIPISEKRVNIEIQ